LFNQINAVAVCGSIKHNPYIVICMHITCTGSR